MTMEHGWNFIYTKYDPAKEALHEALCTLGNGNFATRGAQEENSDNGIHYPGTYLAGGYNRLHSHIAGKVVENEDLVNWPNWLLLKFKCEGSDWIDLDKVKITEFKQDLNLKEGILERTVVVEHDEDRRTCIKSRRLVHMTYKHLAAIEWEFTALNWSGNIVVHSALDASVINNGVARYRDLNSRHLEPLATGKFGEKGIYVKVRTSQSEITMVQAARTEISIDKPHTAIHRETIEREDYVAQELGFNVDENSTVKVTKTVAIYTSRDMAIADPYYAAENAIARAEPFKELVRTQRHAWAKLWERMNTTIVSDSPDDQLGLRMHIFHLLQTVNGSIGDQDIGVPARGWHGEAYRGHIFWDEIFIFPFLNLGMPELTRSLLMYRYRRLPMARYNATSHGYEGAMFPWQSGSDGREESQEIHLNPDSGNWLPDDSRLQRHVNAAIAYNVWMYYQVSNDLPFMYTHGAELICDIAKFWASKATWSEEKGKYEIIKVVGPDEYHTSYPDSDEPGLHNNAYTNVMVIWVMKHALAAMDLLDDRTRNELMVKLDISAENLDRWMRISNTMFIPFIEGTMILSQFEGFENLEELDWKDYHEKHGEVLRLDRILEKEGRDVNRYKATKQADVLMLFYLFSAEELMDLIRSAGYEIKPAFIPGNIAYYESRTSHGSTLSKLVHSWVHARSDRSKSWENFRTALGSDLKDIQGGTTAEGIHLGAMAGTVDLIQRCYTGLEVREEAIWFQPQLPDEVPEIAFCVRYRGHWLSIRLMKKELVLSSSGGWSHERIKVMVNHKPFYIKKGESRTFKYGKYKVDVA